MTVTAIVAVYALAFTIYDPSTEGALLKLGTWSPLLGVLGILAVQALVSIAIIRFFLTSGRTDFHWWTTLVAPLLGFAAMVAACVLLVINRGDLSGAADAVYIQILPWVVLGVFVLGVVLAVVLRSTAPERYARIGQFEITDSAAPRTNETTGVQA
jgi:hypothetical protein